MSQNTQLSFNFNTGKRILRGKELEDYIKANPTKDVALLDPVKLAQGQQYILGYKEGDQGILGNLAREIIRPFYNVARDIKGDEMLTDAEKDNRTRFRLQNIAGIGANFIPIGKVASIGNIARAGAIAGGLQSLSTADLNKPININEIATGALTGGALAGSLGLIAKKINQVKGATSATKQQVNPAKRTLEEIADDAGDAMLAGKFKIEKTPQGMPIVPGNKIEKFGKNLQLNDMLKASPKRGNVDFFRDFEFRKANIANTLDQLQLPYTPEGMQIAVDALRKGSKQIVQNADIKTPTIKEITQEALKKAVNYSPSANTEQLRGLINNQLGNAFKAGKDLAKGQSLKNLTPAELFDVMTDNAIRRIKLETQLRAGIQVPREEMVAAAGIEQTIRDLLNSKIPGFADRSGALYSFIESSPDLANYMNRTGMVSQQGIVNPLNLANKTITQSIGSGIRRLGGVNPTQAISNLKTNITAPIPNLDLKTAFTLGQSGRIPNTGQTVQPVNEPTAEPGFYINQPDNGFETNNRQQKLTKQEAFATAMQITNGNVSQAIQLANFLMSGEKDSAQISKEKKNVEIAEANLNMLMRDLENNQSRFNPLINSVSGLANIIDPERARLETKYKSVVQQIAKDLEGGRMTDQDRRFYEQFMPTLGDTADVVRQKLKGLQEMINVKKQTLLN
jgi:hypothetical protein